MDPLQYPLPSFAILDNDDCAVVLSHEMDFDYVYKLRPLAPQSLSGVPANPYNQNGMNHLGYAPTQNGSLLYSPTTAGGASVFMRTMNE